MVGMKGPDPALWSRWRDPPVHDERYDAMKVELQKLFRENREAHPIHKRLPYKQRHIAQYKAAMRKGNLSAAAWSLSYLGVDTEMLNGIAMLVVG